MQFTDEIISQLTKYLTALARGGGLFNASEDDVVSETMTRLLEEADDVNRDTLFFRAKILFSEVRADYYTGSLPLSGIGRSAHNAALKYLQQNDWNPALAYANQNTTVKVSLRLLQALKRDSLTIHTEAVHEDDFTHDDALSLPMRSALGTLSELEHEVLMMYAGMEHSPMTVAEIAEELELNRRTVVATLKDAQKKMIKAL